MKKKITNIFLLFLLIFNSISYGFYTTIPTWSDLEITEVNAETTNNVLTLESESAILIEQTTRSNSF